MKPKTFWIIVIILLIVTYVNIFYREKLLLSNSSHGYGYVIRVDSGVKTGGGIIFRLKDIDTPYNLTFSKSVPCERAVVKILPQLKGVYFPVIYESSNPSNAKILLFKGQYEKYGVEIPEELEAIVADLSECEGSWPIVW